MKRTQDCDKDDHSLQDDKGGYGAEGFAVASCGRLAKTARTGAAIHGDAMRDGCCSVLAPIDTLTDDILYHLFNGTRVDGAAVFPPECRWAPALVCRRWRNVIVAITRADARAMSGRLRDALWDAPPPEKAHHHSIVRASGMALMVRHGLSSDSVGAWTAKELDPADVAAVLMASGMPKCVDEAVALANQAPMPKKWLSYVRWLRFHPSHYGFLESCSAKGWEARHVLIAAAAGSWDDSRALADLMQSHKPCCIGTAALHAARHGRVGVVRALLALIPPNDHGNLVLVGAVFDNMWQIVGKHGLLAVADFLVGLEQGRDLIIRLTEDERRELARVRNGYMSDNGWNWLSDAAEHNRIECLDFCARRGLDSQVPDVTVAMAALQGHAEFYDRVKTHTSSLINAISHAIDWHYTMQPRALAWVVERPEFDPFHDQPQFDPLCDRPQGNYRLDLLFNHARDQGASDVEILRAAAVVVRRWPDVWERQQSVPYNYHRHTYGSDASDVWLTATMGFAKARAWTGLPDAVRDEIEIFLVKQRAWYDSQDRRECARLAFVLSKED